MVVAQNVRAVVIGGKPGEIEENLECFTQDFKSIQ